METCLAIAGGFVLLIGGGEMLVRGAVSVARALKVTPLLIGLTLVGFGTSAPELVTSVVAALEGSPGIAAGNIVGSNIANILLVLGLAALVHPLGIDPKGFRRDALWLMAASLALLALVLWGDMDRPSGIALIAAIVVYVVRVARSEPAEPDVTATARQARGGKALSQPLRPGLAVLLAGAGIAATILGARLLVSGAIELARLLAVSETVIGLTIVAVGTSLPEMVTSLVAAYRRQADIAYGNIVGSNIYNILFILGVTATVQPIPIPVQIARLDIWVMLAATGLLVYFGRSGFSLTRWEGAAFVATYAAYVWYLATHA